MLVLVAEDDWSIAVDFYDTLTHAGFRVVTAKDAPAAMNALARETPAVATVALNLFDGLTGPDVAQALVDAGVPTIVCSGDPRARDIIGEIPVERIIAKPIMPVALLNAVLDALEIGAGGKADLSRSGLA